MYAWRRFGLMVTSLVPLTKSLRFTLSPVNTWMVDCVGVQLMVTESYLDLTNHTGQLSLAIPPWVSGMSTVMVF